MLAGEKTYEIEIRKRRAFGQLARLALDLLRDDGAADVALLGLERSSVTVAALMVRAARNLDADDARAGDATCACPHALTEAMCWVVRDIEACAHSRGSDTG